MTILIDKSELSLERCPHCGVHKPRLVKTHSQTTKDHSGVIQRVWSLFVCATCGGVTMTARDANSPFLEELWPEQDSISASVPDPAREYLTQALESFPVPMPVVILSASSIDAMLKKKGLKEGSLYSRIDKAADINLITPDMKAWAHEVRLDANEQRHADENAPLPTIEDAKKCVEFAKALAQFLFVLPDMVTRGRKAGENVRAPGSGVKIAEPKKTTTAPKPPLSLR